MALIWNKVTWYSKLLAVIFFLLVLPIWTFYIGRQYENTIISLVQNSKIKVEDTIKIRPPKQVTSIPNAASISSYSGIEGIALVSPTCPVERIDEPCPPKPLAAYIVIKNEKGSTITQTVSAKDGSFAIFLEPGKYTISRGDSDKPFPSLSPVEVTVVNNKMTGLTLSFDSGIR